MIWIGTTLKEFTQLQWDLLSQTMESCKATIAFCPMLAILFVGTRMRALLITKNRGAPQGCDEDGTPELKPKHPILVYCALGLKWITFLFLYGGVIAVIVGVYTMTPETANGRGSIPLAGDGKIPGTDVGV